MYAEQKWESSLAKTAYAAAFPAMIKSETDATGKSIERTVRLELAQPFAPLTLIVYSDNIFRFEPMDFTDIARLMSALKAAKAHLQEQHSEAFGKLDALIARDAEMSRLSKMEKVLSSIVNNIADLPELYDLVSPVVAGAAAEIPAGIEPLRRVRIERILSAVTANLPAIPELADEIPKLLLGTSELVQCDIMKRILSERKAAK